MLTPAQERELEKVNAFYLQKEAEVSCSVLSSARAKRGPGGLTMFMERYIRSSLRSNATLRPRGSSPINEM